jgi:hypothetical protein
LSYGLDQKTLNVKKIYSCLWELFSIIIKFILVYQSETSQSDFLSCSNLKLNHVTIISIWLGQLDKFKCNIDMTGKKHSLALQKIQDDIFLNIEVTTYWIDLGFMT